MNNIYPYLHLHVSESPKPLGPTHPFREVRWKSSERIPQHSQSTEAFYLLKTAQRIETVLRYWKILDIFKGLDLNLERALYDYPGVFRDQVYWALKRAKNVLLHQSEEQICSDSSSQTIPRFLLGRIQQLQSKLGLPLWSWNFLYALENQFRYDLSLNFRETRKVKKYSGYIRTPSAVGSKRKTSIEDPIEILGETETEEISEDDFLNFFLSPTEDYSLLGITLEAHSARISWNQETQEEYIQSFIRLHLGYQGPGSIFLIS